MELIKRCHQCNGNKEAAPLGFIFKKCQVCSGLGYISYQVEEQDQHGSEAVQKKRGRPKQ